MAISDDISAALAAGNYDQASALIQQAKLAAALSQLETAVLAGGNLQLTVGDWTPVIAFWNQQPTTVEEQAYSPAAVFDLARDAFVQALKNRDASGMLAAACIIAKAVRRPGDDVPVT